MLLLGLGLCVGCSTGMKQQPLDVHPYSLLLLLIIIATFLCFFSLLSTDPQSQSPSVFTGFGPYCTVSTACIHYVLYNMMNGGMVQDVHTANIQNG